MGSPLIATDVEVTANKHLRPNLSKKLSDAELLQKVGFFYVYFQEVKANALQIKRFLAQGIIGLRRHQRDDGEVVDAYEVTDVGLERLRKQTDDATAERTRAHREYLREQAKKNKID
jgi:hypothetical protein